MAGPADFDHVARAYIAAHPSRHPSVRWFGRGLADFLAARRPYSTHAGRRRDGALRMGAGRGLRLARRDADHRRRADGAAAGGVGDAQLHRPALAAPPDPSPSRCRRPGSAARRSSPATFEVERAPEPLTWAIWRPDLMSNFRSLDRRRSGDARRAGRGPPLPRAVRSAWRRSPAKSRRPPAPPACYAPGRGRHDRGRSATDRWSDCVASPYRNARRPLDGMVDIRDLKTVFFGMRPPAAFGRIGRIYNELDRRGSDRRSIRA